MTDISFKLADTKFHNWLKTGLAIGITKHGLEDVVAKEITKFQTDTLRDVSTPQQIADKDFCSQCRTENILHCPTRGVCVTKTGRCTFHKTCDDTYRPCPKNICEKLRDKIRKSHKFNFPTWKNTFAERWYQSSWEIAKCFMPEGYHAAKSVHETDLNGVLSVILNFQPIAKQVDETHCNEAREVSRKFRHSADLSVKDTEMNYSFDILDAFLTHSYFLSNDIKVREAVTKIKQLKQDVLTVSTQDVTKVLRDEIENSTRSSLQELNKKKVQILQDVNNAISTLQATTSKTIGDVLSAKTTALTEIGESKRKALDEFDTETKRIKKEIANDIHKSKEASLDAINEATKTSVAEVKQLSVDLDAQKKLDEYTKLKKSLKEDLFLFYEDEHSSIPVSPLFPQQDAEILPFFVPPKLEIAEWRISGKKSPTKVHSFRDMFMHMSSACHNIYISAQAGTGKTILAKRIALIWCLAKSGKEIGKDVSESETEMMRYFEFLFLIPLRDVHGKECKVDDMVYSQIICHLSRSSRYSKAFLEMILHDETSLIILEGLDEWSHPHDSTCNNIAQVPHRPSRPHCTIMSTTRPWKMYEAGIKNSKIDKYIIIKRLGRISKEKLVHNVVYNLTGERKDDQSTKDFLDDLKLKNFDGLDSTPVILIQLICLWIDGRTVNSTKCEIFFSIIDFMLQLGSERIETLGRDSILSDIRQKSDTNHLTGIIRNYDYCQNLSDFIHNVGKLAFTALFLERKEVSLVMKSSFVASVLSPDYLWCCLQMGLLTRNKQLRFSENMHTYSFIHKTFQEFFAAFYIQSNKQVSNASDIVLQECNSLGKILEMSNIFVFLSGLRPKLLETFSEKLAVTVSGDSFTRKFRTKVLFVNSERNDKQKLLKEYQSMYIACMKEMQNSQTKICLEDLFFDQDISGSDYCDKLFKLQEMNETRAMSVTLESLDLDLLHKCMFKLDKLKNVDRLFMISELTPEDMEKVIGSSVETLKYLSVCSRSREHGRMVAKFTYFTGISLNVFQRMDNLEALVLECFEMSHSVLVSFIEWISQRLDMKQIGLLIKCSEHDKTCPGISLDLSKHSKLESLELCSLRLLEVKINTTALQDCHVGSLSSYGLSLILDCMPKAKDLRAIEFYDMNSESNIEKFLKILKLFDYLEVIELNEVDLTNKEIELPHDMIKLKCIMLVDVSMSCKALQNLLKRVEKFRNPVRVMLWYCDIKQSEDFEKVKDEIRHSASYRVLQDWRESDKNYMFTFKSLKADH